MVGILLLFLVSGLILTGCSSGTSSTAPSVASSPYSTGGGLPPPAQAAAKTLKIGVAFALGTSVGLDALHGIQLLVDEDNKNGGIDIGGEKYQIELVSYDTQASQATEVSAINRLVYQDNVKFILTVGQFQGAWLATTESKKVIVMSQDMMAPVDLAANTYYSFNPTFQNPEITSKTGWYIKNNPDKVKNFMTVYLDNQFGHTISMMVDPILTAFGVTPKKNLSRPSRSISVLSLPR